MQTSQMTTKTLRGKYQVTRNIFVTCYLDVLEATDKEIRTFLGLKKRSDTLVPVGTRIYFDAETINKINMRRSNSFDIFSISVQEVEDLNGKPLHVCTTIQKETLTNRRSTDRKEAQFPVRLKGSKASFLAQGGAAQGLTLHYTARRAMLSLTLNQSYEFLLNYKDMEYVLPGQIKHIQYDWKSHEHVVGVHFPSLGEEEDIVLNRLIDPSYTIDISGRQTIDTAEGKISVEED